MKRERLCPGRERAVKSAKDLEPHEFRRLVARRAREISRTDPRELVRWRDTAIATSEDERRKTESDVKAFFEKVHLGQDFLPARFLTDGARRAKAVCRIVTPGGLGTGSLIARGVLLTNNHVLGAAAEAATATAEFDFADGQTVRTVAIEPNRLFITDVELDFTIVACVDESLQDIEPIPLLRNPATVTRGEKVNIIQHPRGRPKEIAIHNNDVTRIQDKVVHYRTDTEPGSSGSPVFNNEWELVALHHAGWGDENAPGSSTNEGIRIAAIVAHLLKREKTEVVGDSSLIERLLGPGERTSPYLGFFDVIGLDAGTHEIEVPDFAGDDRFADVGFWNIEHFNNQVSDQRIATVADVVARLSMDVMGLVEVEGGALTRLADVLRASGDSYGVAVHDVDGSQDLAVLFDKDTSRVTLRSDIAQRNQGRLNAKTSTGRTAFPRSPLFAKCSVGEGNELVEFVMIVVHLKAFGDAESRERRRLATEKLGEIIDDIRAVDKLPVVLGGDFNELLTTDVLSAIKDSPDLFALTSDDAVSGAISFVGDSHRSLIDHIVVSNDTKLGSISGDDAAIVRLDRTIGDFAGKVSDHVPVVVRLVHRGEPIPAPPSGGPSERLIPIPAGAANVRIDFPT
jgi:endonuclease/exonuclease/phosphatase family metal-dependent hydrolase/V8-like Glu-specific endopeptidase